MSSTKLPALEAHDLAQFTGSQTFSGVRQGCCPTNADQSLIRGVVVGLRETPISRVPANGGAFALIIQFSEHGGFCGH